MSFPRLFEGVPVSVREAGYFRQGEKAYNVTFANGVVLQTEPNFKEMENYLPEKVLKSVAGMAGYQTRWRLLLRLNNFSQIAEVLESDQLRIGIPLA